MKHGPLNEPFDPNNHKAVFHVPDASKPEGTFALVLKVLNYLRFALFLALITLLSICYLFVIVCFRILQSEYTLSDRVKRPAEVCVTCAVGNQVSEKESEA